MWSFIRYFGFILYAARDSIYRSVIAIQRCYVSLKIDSKLIKIKVMFWLKNNCEQKLPFRGVLRKNVYWIHAANLQEETHAEVEFQNFIEITLRHGCSPVKLLHIFRAPFPKNTSGWLLLDEGSYPRNKSFLIKLQAFRFSKVVSFYQ